jgi:hypothetical protein
MSPHERDYYRQRGRAERLRAAEASDTLAAEIHEELACLYEKIVELDDEEPKVTVVTVG